MGPQDAKKFIAALRSPLIRPFIDTSRLLMSSQFEAAAKAAINQRVMAGDTTFAFTLLEVFAASPSYNAILHWLCDHGAMTFSTKGQAIRLHISKAPRKTSKNLVEYLSLHKGSKQSVLSPAAPAQPELTGAQKLAKRFGPDDGRRGGKPFLQGGAPGLGRR